MRWVSSGLILTMAALVVLECGGRPPQPRVVHGHRKHPRKTADTILLGPPVIMEDDPVVICARRFVRAMLDNDQAAAEALISPKWLEEDGISMDTFMVSLLELPELPPPPRSRYMVTDVEGDKVSVEVTTESGRMRRLAMQVSKENGRYYVVPSGADHCCGSVDPWYWPPDR